MDFWIITWTIILFASLLLYTGLAIVVTLGGYKDVQALFKSLEDQHAAEDQEE